MARNAIVAGASRGTGRAVAPAPAEEGFDVAAVALPDAERMADLAGTVAATGRRFASYALDLASARDHMPVLEAIARDLGAVDSLVTDAGASVRRRGDLLEVSLDSYDASFDVNTRGTFFRTQERRLGGDGHPRTVRPAPEYRLRDVLERGGGDRRGERVRRPVRGRDSRDRCWKEGPAAVPRTCRERRRTACRTRGLRLPRRVNEGEREEDQA